MGLTRKNQLFLEEYIKNNYTNATEAYMRVYDGSYDTAKGQASKILKKPEAIEYIQEIQRKAYQEAGITAERIALHLASIAFDENDLFASSNQIRALDLLQKQLGVQKQALDITQDTVIDIKIEE